MSHPNNTKVCAYKSGLRKHTYAISHDRHMSMKLLTIVQALNPKLYVRLYTRDIAPNLKAHPFHTRSWLVKML